VLSSRCLIGIDTCDRGCLDRRASLKPDRDLTGACPFRPLRGAGVDAFGGDDRIKECLCESFAEDQSEFSSTSAPNTTESASRSRARCDCVEENIVAKIATRFAATMAALRQRSSLTRPSRSRRVP